jgi:glycosyltransferase involved in cell wall biosynthesis
MSKKKLIIFAPNASEGGAPHLIEAINMYSKKYIAEGLYTEEIPYNFIKEEQKKCWRRLFVPEDLNYIMDHLQKPDVYFFGLSGRAVEMLMHMFLLHHCLTRERRDDRIEFLDEFSYKGEKSKNSGSLSRVEFMQLVLSAFKGADGALNVATCMSLLMPTDNESIAVNMFMDYLSHNKLHKRIAFWWTDSSYRQDPEYHNRITDVWGLQTFAMLELLRLDKKALPLMQTYDFDIIEDKDEEFTVIHTPGLRESRKKGTDIVKKVVDKFKDIKFKIYGKNNFIPNEQILHEKKKSHVCIDKITDDEMLGSAGVMGGMGMSALEAIFSGIPTICSMQDTPSDGLGRYNHPPAIDVRNEAELEKELEKLSTDKDYYNEISNKTKEWAKVLTYKSTVKYLDEVLYNG